MRATLALGAQPPAPGGGSSMDSVSTRATANPSALSNVAKALKKGPASAVDDVDELYEAGLPRGLPGGLHVIAINERAELLSRLARVKAAQEALVGRRKAPSQVSAQRAGRSFGAYDAHAPAAGAADASSSGAPQNEQGEAVAAAAAADYGAAQELDEDDPLAEEAGGAPEAGDADLSGGEGPSDEGEAAPWCRPCYQCAAPAAKRAPDPRMISPPRPSPPAPPARPQPSIAPRRRSAWPRPPDLALSCGLAPPRSRAVAGFSDLGVACGGATVVCVISADEEQTHISTHTEAPYTRSCAIPCPWAESSGRRMGTYVIWSEAILFGAAAACAAAAHARSGVRRATERPRATCRSQPPGHASRRPSRAPGGCSRGFVLASDREPRKHMIAPRARAAWPTPRSSSRTMPLAKQAARAGATAYLGPAGRSERERERLGADQVARLVGRRARRRAIKTAQLDAGLGRA